MTFRNILHGWQGKQVSSFGNLRKERKANNPSIITNGLVVHLDAGDPRSYTGSGTTWSDLSGNGLDATLTNGPTYSNVNNGTIVLDGVNDYIQLPTSSSLTMTGDFTFSCWILLRTNATSPHIWSTPDAQTLQLNLSDIIYYNSTNGNQVFGSYTTNNWYNIVLSRTGSTMTAFLNGQRKFSNTYSVTHNFSGIGIGYRSISPTGYYWPGNLPNVNVYNRGLSSSEVMQNFNAMRVRYGV